MATLEQIQARMKKLQAQAEALIAKRAQAALDQIRELMLKHGFTTEDIEARAKARRERARATATKAAKGKTKRAATKGKLPPKYRDPKTGATWSGKARPPAWIKDVKDRSKFLINEVGAKAAAAVAVAGKTAAKKTSRKAAAKKTVTRKVAAKKAGAKTAAKKTSSQSPASSTAKRAAARKTPAKQTPARAKRSAAALKTAATMPADAAEPSAKTAS